MIFVVLQLVSLIIAVAVCASACRVFPKSSLKRAYVGQLVSFIPQLLVSLISVLILFNSMQPFLPANILEMVYAMSLYLYVALVVLIGLITALCLIFSNKKAFPEVRLGAVKVGAVFSFLYFLVSMVINVIIIVLNFDSELPFALPQGIVDSISNFYAIYYTIFNSVSTYYFALLLVSMLFVIIGVNSCKKVLSGQKKEAEAVDVSAAELSFADSATPERHVDVEAVLNKSTPEYADAAPAPDYTQAAPSDEALMGLFGGDNTAAPTVANTVNTPQEYILTEIESEDDSMQEYTFTEDVSGNNSAQASTDSTPWWMDEGEADTSSDNDSNGGKKSKKDKKAEKKSNKNATEEPSVAADTEETAPKSKKALKKEEKAKQKGKQVSAAKAEPPKSKKELKKEEKLNAKLAKQGILPVVEAVPDTLFPSLNPALAEKDAHFDYNTDLI